MGRRRMVEESKCICGEEAVFEIKDVKTGRKELLCSRHFITFADGFKNGYIFGLIDALIDKWQPP